MSNPFSYTQADVVAALTADMAGPSGTTCTKEAVDAAVSTFATYSRADARKLMFIITDGKSSTSPGTCPVAADMGLAVAGIESHAIGVGNY